MFAHEVAGLFIVNFEPFCGNAKSVEGLYALNGSRVKGK